MTQTTKPTSSYVKSAELYAAGRSVPEIAMHTGRAVGTVHRHLWKARKEGLLPPVGRRVQGGLAAWEHYKQKGAAPPMGVMGRVVDRLTTKEIDDLLAIVQPDDETLAVTVARIVKERLDGRT